MRIDRTLGVTTLTLFLALISLGFLTPTPAFASELPPIPQIVYSTTTAQVIIEAYAAHYGTPADPLVATLKCESGFNDKSIGDFGTSFGVAQIHLPAHKDISKAQALDPLFSIDFAAHEFSKGNARIWSCYKLLYPTGSNGT